MVTALALVTAVAFGVADFLGGAVSRRSTALKTLVLSAPMGLLVAVAAALLAGGAPAPGPIAWGFLGGLAGGVGLIAFYRALARGPMNVVAPVSALASAVLPVGVGVLRGERLDETALLGVLLCLLAIGLVSMEKGGEDEPSATASLVRRPLDSGPLMALVSGSCFGVFFIMLKAAGDGAGLWPIATARIGTLTIVFTALLIALRTRGGDRGPWVSGRTLIGLALLSGILDSGANALYYLAVQDGLLSLVTVLTSLYPAITVLLARIAYSERLRAVQRVGMAIAVAGVALVTVG
ncbi:DMT family transporter [Actinomadura montaniterrae]|uniref:DMT family transporter n=1 Tax=Actinomadura montaniterrae TaxID=1803903 RepID=A0A6L3W2G5_9ACTN|nr:DMT family transporter [Actinomadura montaniterrae]KAB2381054.1 DMT family transporter [Actinomadura montaniterrae]